MREHRLAVVSLVFGTAFAGLLILPTLLRGVRDAHPGVVSESALDRVLTLLRGGGGLHPGMTTGDTLDLLTPLVLIPLYWLLFAYAAGDRPSTGETVLFAGAAALWVEGQAMHLAANSIANFLGESGGALPSLAYFYDEVLSHYLWQTGAVALSGLILWRGWRSATVAQGSVVPFLAGALLYGGTFFLMVVEGATVPLGLPAAAVLVAVGLWRWIARRPAHPLGTLFVGGYALALVLMLAWGVWQQGFPEFSEVGFLD